MTFSAFMLRNRRPAPSVARRRRFVAVRRVESPPLALVG
jgi:hypothetical protein